MPLYSDDGIRFFAHVPKSYKNISNFDALTDLDRKAFGFYPVDDQVPLFDPEVGTAILGPVTFDDVNEIYIRTYIVVPKTLQERQDVVRHKRMMAYPQMTDYLDAQVKKASADPVVQAAGVAQEAAYLAACEAVKVALPIPTV